MKQLAVWGSKADKRQKKTVKSDTLTDLSAPDSGTAEQDSFSLLCSQVLWGKGDCKAITTELVL